jgi:transmembrane sensor
MRRIPDRDSAVAIEAAASDWIVRRDSGLSDQEQRAFANWLAADPRHAAAVGELEQAWTFLDRPRAAGRADEMAGKLRSRVSERRRRLGLGVAAVALISFVATSMIRQSPHPTEIDRPPVGVVVLAPEKQTLPDGTVVELKPGAEVVTNFDGPLRRVVLRRGEALFQVASDPHRTFVVAAGDVEVRAVGTAFAVQMAESGVEVVVTEGSVSVEKAGAPTGPDVAGEPEPIAPLFSTLVAAGERMSVDRAGDAAGPQPVAITSDEIADRLSWRATRIDFSNTPLAEVVGLMNRHSTLQLIVDDPALAGVRVNGLFRADNTETLVRLLEASFGVKTERFGNNILLRRARFSGRQPTAR